MNAGDIKAKLATGNGRADRLAKSDRPAEEKIHELYMAAFSREPRPMELKVASEYLAEPRVDAAGNPIDPARRTQKIFRI